MAKHRKEQGLDQDEITQIFDIMARQARFTPAQTLPQVVQAVLQKLSSLEIPSFYSEEAQVVIVDMMKQTNCEPLVQPYLQYCSERRYLDERKSKQQRSSHAMRKPPQSDRSHGRYFVVTPKDECLPWEKEKITTALEREGEIPYEVASQIAHVVESKIFQSQLRHITTAQIRELVNNELFSMGYRTQLQKKGMLGLPKFNLKSMLYHEYQQGVTQEVGELIAAIASTILHQYSLEEVFGQEVVDAHLSGLMHIEGIAWPVQIFSTLLKPAITSIFGELESPEEQVVAILTAAEKFLPYTLHSCNIVGIDSYLKSSEVPTLRALIAGLSHHFYRSFPYAFWLQRPPGEFSDRLFQVYQEIDKRNLRNFLPALTIPVDRQSFGPSRPSLLRMCEMARRIRKVTFMFRENTPAVWPDPANLPFAFDSIALNLVHAALLAGKHQLGEFWNKLSELMLLVIRAHLDKKRFFSSLAEGPLRLLFQDKSKDLQGLENMAGFVEVIGLPEAIYYLTDLEMDEGEGWEMAIQTLARIKELAESAWQKHLIHICPVDYMRTSEAQQRFAKTDMEKFPEARNLFCDSVYTKGPHFRLGHNLTLREKIRREGQLHRYLPSAIALMPEMDENELCELLRFTFEETEAMALRIC